MSRERREKNTFFDLVCALLISFRSIETRSCFRPLRLRAIITTTYAMNRSTFQLSAYYFLFLSLSFTLALFIKLTLNSISLLVIVKIAFNENFNNTTCCKLGWFAMQIVPIKNIIFDKTLFYAHFDRCVKRNVARHFWLPFYWTSSPSIRPLESCITIYLKIALECLNKVKQMKHDRERNDKMTELMPGYGIQNDVNFP